MASEKISPKGRIIFAHDNNLFEKKDEQFYRSIRRYVGWIKVGLQAMSYERPPGITTATRLRKFALKNGFDVMWDAKLDDIPNTTANAVANVAHLGSKMLTIHASAGPASLAAAHRAWIESRTYLRLLAVTVLTSIDSKGGRRSECVSIFGDKPEKKVVQFAKMAYDLGISGIVCSPKELRALADAGLLKYLVTVVPGVRPEWASLNDQKRVMTPAQAIRAGAHMLVIGRPISEHESPAKAARLIWEEIEAA